MRLRYIYGGVPLLMIGAIWVFAIGTGASVAMENPGNYTESRQEVTGTVEDVIQNSTADASMIGKMAFHGFAGPILYTIDAPIGYAYDIGYRAPWLAKPLMTGYTFLMYGGIIWMVAKPIYKVIQ